MKKSVRCYLVTEGRFKEFARDRKKGGCEITAASKWYGLKITLKGARKRVLSDFTEELKQEFGGIFVREEAESLPRLVVAGYKKENLVVSLAESCTGGLVSARLTDVPGSSDMFWGSCVVYSNDFKRALGVSQETLDREGAVSEAAVRELAKAVLLKGKSDVGLSISGIAGPGGGSDIKPVGTVWMGVQTRLGVCEAYEFRFTGTRKNIRRKSCIAACCLLLGLAEGKNLLDSIKKTQYSIIYCNQNK